MALIDVKAPKKNTSPFDFFNIKKRIADNKFEKQWANRNFGSGEMFVESLEVDYCMFQQNIFVESSTELLAKLKRLGFETLEGYPDSGLFDGFSSILYLDKHNVALSVYRSVNKKSIHLACDIVDDTKAIGDNAQVIFLSVVNNLMMNKV